MSKLNILLDRELLDSAHIQSRQNFELILHDLRSIKQPLSSRAWFYGAVGTASVAIGVSVVNLDHIAKVEVQPADSPISHSQIPVKKVQFAEIEKPTTTPTVQRLSIIERHESVPTKTNVEPDQKNTVIMPPEKPARQTLLPHVNGVYDGQISVTSFCEKGKLECNHSEFIIKGFSFEWFDGSEDIRQTITGDHLPEELCKNILNLTSKESVYITEIIAGKKDEEATFILPSMHLELIP